MIQSIMPRMVLRATLLVVLLAAAAETSAEDSKDILYFGNSFTNAVGSGSSRSVPDVLKDVAVAAGHPAPRNRNASVNSQSWLWHLQHNTAVITTGIAAGEKWDDVVLQDFSTEPTHIGNLASHRSSAVALYQAVAAHSPGVIPIMFETWARGPGFSYYTGANPLFPGGPAQMQQEVRDGYRLSTQDINAAIGANLARYAPVGDAWELAGFPRNFYASDIYHAQNRGTLLNALVLYQTIYGDPTTSDIPLSSLLVNLKLSDQDGVLLTSLADATRVPEPASPITAGIVMLTCAVRRNRITHCGWLSSWSFAAHRFSVTV